MHPLSPYIGFFLFAIESNDILGDIIVCAHNFGNYYDSRHGVYLNKNNFIGCNTS